MRTSSLLSLFLIVSVLLLSQSHIISSKTGSTIKPLDRKLVEHEEYPEGSSHGHHHHGHLRAFVKKSKKSKKKKKSSATRNLLSSPLTYLSTVVTSFVLLLAAF
ncbi:hypothetical protein Bca4012_080679 [Brassica carinata]|uniref:Transmembrane protein n=4 Tax=Brassica TaxID=3705 RepID=A0A8X7NTE9_BRACI|nr:PREDICTED: uncharacterized protein LOC106305298 [Brassica oleracea var. oleracea]XP_013705738.1 uncharacterized protein BNAC07G42830D [Brassica napus]KAG2238285.1 hypothetical protein Bca52824_092497 [Brassica carinata]VDD40713.1 unnamed protein product [Brassica oleracea]KAG2238287.1 hypothetical protein Bca52824_092499 [Brassica carinata]CAF2030666.1 unnamed protein product [Brassica napus]